MVKTFFGGEISCWSRGRSQYIIFQPTRVLFFFLLSSSSKNCFWRKKAPKIMNFKSLFNTDQSCIQTTTYIRTLTHIPSFQSLRNKSENPATSFLPRLTHHTHTSIHTQKNKKPQTKPNQNLPPRPSWQQAVIVERLSTQSALQITAKEKKIEFIKTRTQKKKIQAEHRGTRFPLAPPPSPPPGAPGAVAPPPAPSPLPPLRPSSCLMIGLLLRCGV